MTTPENELSELFEERAAAMTAKDIERLIALYSDDIVYFDVASGRAIMDLVP